MRLIVQHLYMAPGDGLPHLPEILQAGEALLVGLALPRGLLLVGPIKLRFHPGQRIMQPSATPPWVSLLPATMVTVSQQAAESMEEAADWMAANNTPGGTP